MNELKLNSSYHGTSEKYALDLINGKVDTSLGGGELGQGFYLGDALHVAKAWAKQKYNSEVVVEFQIDEDDLLLNFNIECLNRSQAIYFHKLIKANGSTRKYLFFKDIVWAPIVGGPKLYADQYKWESKKGQCFLNGSSVLRVKR